MNILVVSEFGKTAGFASRLQREGNNVRLLLTQPGRVFFDSETVSSDAAFEIASDNHYDCVVIDSATNGRLGERIRKAGTRVIGGSAWSEAVAGDNAYLKSVLASVGIPTELSSTTNGVNLYVTGWFNGARFISRYVSLVYRRMMVGGKGRDMGCIGSLSFHKNRSGKPYTNILKPLEHVLRRVNHRGPIHAHAFVTPDGYSVTELNTDLAHPLSFVATEGVRATATELLASLMGESLEELHTKAPWSSSALVAYPPYPYHNDLGVAETPRLPGINNGVFKHIFPVGIRMIGDDAHVSGGEVCYVLGGGDNFTEAVRRMYRTISNIEVTNCMYRTDVGRNVQGLLYNLEKWEWTA